MSLFYVKTQARSGQHNAHIMQLMDFEFIGGQNTRKWNSEVINPIFNGLTYSVCGNFLNAHTFSVN